ncbi:MAG TPA: type II secretion system F family protein [Candidatus Saccharimonadales bacterium]|nr:type II secretion system F family protein [Candidatus Saccharimonadales bacterium]
MLTYVYTARDKKTGNKVQADIEAENEKTAAKLLIDRGLNPIEIKLRDEPSSTRTFLNRIPNRQIVIFSRQLATLINAGLPLVQSLSTVQEQTTNKSLKVVVGKVITDVEAGSTLSDSMSKHPKVFNDIYVSLVAAGETSGTLDKSLERLANQQERDAETRSKIRGAMIYPFLVIGVLVAVVVFMSTAVIPQVQNLYNGLPGAQLPLITRLLLGVSHFITHFWWLLVILIGVGIYGTARWSRTPGGKKVMDELKLTLPVVGPLAKQLYMARFARTGSILIASGIPMIKMLDTTARAVSNVHVAESIHKATEKVKGGKALSESLAGDPYFLELVPNMIRIGEQSGQLEGIMSKVADYYENEVDTTIKNLSTIVEPVLMIIVGIMALIVVAAVLLPIYSLAGKNFLHT